jgi:hypothetical protein
VLDDDTGPSGNTDELYAVLWLNPFAVPSDGNVMSDGIEIYEEASSGMLFAQGISIYPSVHPSFLSSGGNLTIDMAARCKGATSEIIPRRNNRLVLINSRVPFSFRSSSTSLQSKEKFHRRTSVVLVIQMSLFNWL